MTFLTEVYLECQMTQKDLQITTFKSGFCKAEKKLCSCIVSTLRLLCVYWAQGMLVYGGDPGQTLFVPPSAFLKSQIPLLQAVL